MIVPLLILLIIGIPLTVVSEGQEILRPNRIISKAHFYQLPPGTVAWIPQVFTSSDAKYAGQWDVLVEGGRYVIPRADKGPWHCFVVNHRDLGKGATESYVAVGALSILRPRTNPLFPLSLYRNEGWARSNDPESRHHEVWWRETEITSEMFGNAHAQDTLEENERILGIEESPNDWWHGSYDTKGIKESWANRLFWQKVVSIEPGRLIDLGWSANDKDVRFDAKLIRFTFTQKRVSDKPVAFCVRGDRRIATILTVYGPDLGPTQQFELVFQQQ